MWIAFKDLHGAVPLYRDNPRELPRGYAQVARNCKIENGAIKPIKGLTTITTPTKTGTKQTIFRYKSTNPPIWLHWLSDVDVVRSLAAGDTTGLVLFTDGVFPKITDSVHATTDGTDYPEVSFRPGAPQPDAAPSIAVNGDAPGEGDDEVIETLAYRFCFVAIIGGVEQPGPLSDPTSYVDVSFSFGQTVTLSDISTTPGSGYNTTGMVKRIYRATVGETASGWQYVGQISLATTTFVDDTETADLSGVTAESENYYPPPDGMIGIQAMPGGFILGFDGNTLVASEPYLMHAFNPDYIKRVDYPIVAIGIFGQTAAILTEGQPYLYSGSHPSSATLDKLDSYRSCKSKTGVVDFGGTLLYPSPEGIAFLGITNDGLDAGMSSDGLLDLDTWDDNYAPATIKAYRVQGWYIGFYDNDGDQAGFMFNPITKEFVDLDTFATAGFNDLADDKLYLQIGDDIVLWDSDSASPLTMSYKTRPERVPYPVCMGYGRVIARGYPVTFSLYNSNDVLIKTITVTGRDPFIIGSGYMSDEYTVEISGTYQVDWFAIGETIFDIEEAYSAGEL